MVTASSEPEDEDELEPLIEPTELGAVLWVRYLDDDTVQLSVAGYDAGYLYTYQFGREDPVQSIAVPDNDDLEVSSFVY